MTGSAKLGVFFAQNIKIYMKIKLVKFQKIYKVLTMIFLGHPFFRGLVNNYLFLFLL